MTASVRLAVELCGLVWHNGESPEISRVKNKIERWAAKRLPDLDTATKLAAEIESILR